MRNQKPETRNQNRRKVKIFVLSGPSGSGKTTLLEKALGSEELNGRLIKSVSLTTRPKRTGERDAKEYFFVSKEEFKHRQKAKKILEWTKYLGYYYATSRDFIKQALGKKKHIVLCLDFKGALKIKRLYPKNTVTIFIAPPSLETLKKRIEGRCKKTKQEEVRQRLRLAKNELLVSREYDYRLMNKNLPKAVKELKGIILKEINKNYLGGDYGL